MSTNNWIDRLCTRIKLSRGKHIPGNELCIMEAEAYIAGEEHTDHPKCVSPILAQIARMVNDFMTQEHRDKYLAPMLGQFAGTVGTEEDEKKRTLLILDVSIRKIFPIFLRTLKEEQFALRFEALPRIQGQEDIKTAEELMESMKSMRYMGYMRYMRYMGYMESTKSSIYMEYIGYMRYIESSIYMESSIPLLIQLLHDLITIKSNTPKEWSRDPETLPCLIK
jgi:hypothetical protein